MFSNIPSYYAWNDHTVFTNWISTTTLILIPLCSLIFFKLFLSFSLGLLFIKSKFSLKVFYFFINTFYHISIKDNLSNWLITIQKIRFSFNSIIFLETVFDLSELIPKEKNLKQNTNNKNNINIPTNFKLKKYLNKLLRTLKRFFLPRTIYFKNTKIILPSKEIVTIDLITISLDFKNIENDKKIFTFDIKIQKLVPEYSTSSIDDILFQVNFIYSTKYINDDKYISYTLINWSHSLKLSGVHYSIIEKQNTNKNLLIENNNNESSFTLSPNDTTTTNDDVTNQLSIFDNFDKLRESLDRYTDIISFLNVLDIKLSNIKIYYKKIAIIKISSLQCYLTSIDARKSSASNTNILPSSHQLSLSINNSLISIGNYSTFRFPLIMTVISTNIFSFFCDKRLSLKYTNFIVNTNIINPALFFNINDITKIATMINSNKNLQSKNSNISSNTNKNNICLDKYPDLLVEFSMSNFNSTLEVTPNQNLSLNIFETHALFHHEKIKDEIAKPLINDHQFTIIKRKINNHIKVVGVTSTFQNKINHPDTGLITPMNIPICDLDRVDTFIGDISNRFLDVKTTFRNFTFSLNDIVVLEKLAILYLKIEKMLDSLNKKKKNLNENHHLSEMSSSNEEGFFLNSDINVRFKNTKMSLIISNFLSKSMDPLKLNDKNLTSIHRGLIILIDECSLISISNMINKKFERKSKLDLTNVAIFPILDEFDSSHIENLDNDEKPAFQFDFLTWIDNKLTNECSISLSLLHIDIDISLIWLGFLITSVLNDFYFSKRIHKEKTSDLNQNTDDLKKKISAKNMKIDIEKVMVDISLPLDQNLLVSFADICYSTKKQTLTASTISCFVKSVYVKNIPLNITLVNILNFSLDIEQFITNKKILMTTALIRLHTEYHFRFYLLLDGIKTCVKAFKQLKYAFSDLTDFRRLYPLPEVPKILPFMNLYSDEVVIDVEEDPFEQELGLIYKIGILEQRARLKMLEEFEQQSRNVKDEQKLDPIYTDHHSSISAGKASTPSSMRHSATYTSYNNDSDRSERLWEKKAKMKLHEHFSVSWISRYRKARLEFIGMPFNIKLTEFFGRKYYYNITSMKYKNTIASLKVKNWNISISPPSFPMEDYPEFIHQYGGKVPKDRLYTLIFVFKLYVSAYSTELRLRDYPVSILYFPRIQTEGDVVIAERMPSELSTQTIYVPFVPSTKGNQYTNTNSIYGSHIISTLNSLKTIANVKSFVDSSTAAHITWSKAMQPGLESLMLWFDFLTKPQLDPSPKLGFWDKCRNLIHGRWIMEFSEISEFHIHIKGSRDPYKVADDGAGLSFRWSSGIQFHIHDSKDPAEFLKIESTSFNLAIPDFTVPNKFDKILMKLAGNVVWKMGFIFEQGDVKKAGDEPRSIPRRPHHGIELIHPDKVLNNPKHDSFAGFRSSFIHMSIGVYSYKADSINSIDLSPYSLSHFLNWWGLFDSYTSGPIRQGSLFPDLIQNNAKFGRSLFSIKYQLHVENLSVTNLYRLVNVSSKDESFSDENYMVYSGLKGKIRSVKIDLHQKKVKLIHAVEKLNRFKPVWKFRMSTGEVDCQDADIRLIHTKFTKSMYDFSISQRLDLPSPTSGFDKRSSFSERVDSEWYDFEDYIDLNQVIPESYIPHSFQTIPFLFSPRISYFRKINDEGYKVEYPFGDEPSHICIIGENHPELTQEKLVKIRIKELEDYISKNSDEIEKLDMKKTSKNPNKQQRLDILNQRLFDAKKRWRVLQGVLSDLEVSEEYAIQNKGRKKHNFVKEDDAYDVLDLASDFENLQGHRSKTVESFAVMRRVSHSTSKSSYDNRFMAHNVQLCINKVICDHLMEYTNAIFEKKSTHFFMQYKSIDILKTLLESSLYNVKSTMSEFGLMTDEEKSSNSEFIHNYENLVREVPNNKFKTVESYLFQFISPQIQITSPQERDIALILVSRDIDVEMIDLQEVMDKSGKKLVTDVTTIVETRYCSTLKDIQLFTIRKDDLKKSNIIKFKTNGYGMKRHSKYWPPWVPLEVCFNGSLIIGQEFLKKRSMYLTYTAPNSLYFSANEHTNFSTDSKFRVGFPSLAITSTSQQYTAVYNIISSLLSFNNTFDEKVDKLSKLLLAEEVRNNLEKLDVSVVTGLQKKVQDLLYTRAFLKYHKPTVFARHSLDLLNSLQATLLELSVLMSAIRQTYNRMGKSKRDRQTKTNWQVGANKIRWELFDENNKPFVNIHLGSSTYIRSQIPDGANSNLLKIDSLKCINQQEKPTFVDLLAPFENHPNYDKDIPMIQIFWLFGAPVGGISAIEKMVINCQPVVFRMDYITGNSLLNYLFPNTGEEKSQDTNKKSNSPTPQSPSRTISPISRASPPSSPKPSSTDVSLLSSSSSSFMALQGFQPISRVDSQSTKVGSIGSVMMSHVPSSELVSVTSRGSLEPDRGRYGTFLRKSDEPNINEMVLRSGRYFNLHSLVVHNLIISISYKGTRSILTNVNNLLVKVPTLGYQNKIWSRDDLIAAVKKDLIKVVLHHTGNIIGNKLIPHKKEKKMKYIEYKNGEKND